mmetsp:Transcript_79007/g.226477  ORF Transcript_79007/g.226477 Transcript_79007/m.226477 type:complete len:296 (-) Transcript_79007:332-1219(-)
MLRVLPPAVKQLITLPNEALHWGWPPAVRLTVSAASPSGLLTARPLVPAPHCEHKGVCRCGHEVGPVGAAVAGALAAAIVVQLVLLRRQEDSVTVEDAVVLQMIAVHAEEVPCAQSGDQAPREDPEPHPLPRWQCGPGCQVRHEGARNARRRGDTEQDDAEVERVLEHHPTRRREVQEAVHVVGRPKRCLCPYRSMGVVRGNSQCAVEESRALDVVLLLQLGKESAEVLHGLHAVAGNNMFSPEVSDAVMGELQMAGVNKILHEDIVAIRQVTHVELRLPLARTEALLQCTGYGQ